MTRECLTTQARLPGSGRDEQPVITSTKWIIALVSAVLQLIEWKAFAAASSAALNYRGGYRSVTGCGPGWLWSTPTWGLPWPSWQRCAPLCPPLTDSFLLSRTRGEHPIVQLLVDILGRCCRWVSGKQDEEILPAQGGIANVDPAGWN